MRYELYSYDIKDQTIPYFYELESEELAEILRYREERAEKGRRFVIVDNFSVGSINHRQLGFQERPKLEKMIQRVLRCKFAKAIRRMNFNGSLNEFKRSCDEMTENVKQETLCFFKMNAFLETADVEKIYDVLGIL